MNIIWTVPAHRSATVARFGQQASLPRINSDAHMHDALYRALNQAWLLSITGGTGRDGAWFCYVRHAPICNRIELEFETSIEYARLPLVRAEIQLDHWPGREGTARSARFALPASWGIAGFSPPDRQTISLQPVVIVRALLEVARPLIEVDHASPEEIFACIDDLVPKIDDVIQEAADAIYQPGTDWRQLRGGPHEDP
jgi:hypothetical protein